MSTPPFTTLVILNTPPEASVNLVLTAEQLAELFAGESIPYVMTQQQLACLALGAPLTFSGSTPTAAAPTFTPTPATFGSAQTVALASSTPGAAIYYTTDGSTPTTGSTVYSAPLSVSATTTVKAIAGSAGYNTSGVSIGVFTIILTAATPTFAPGGGTYASAQSVTISTTTAGASIYYTTDGSTPTPASTLYSGAISVSASETLQAIAVFGGYQNSAVANASYTISIAPSPAATPTFSPAGGGYSAAQSVAISCSTPGSTIYYTTDGTTPTTGSAVYSARIPVAVSETIQAIATAAGFTQSGVGSAAYTITLPVAATPTFSPAAGTYASAQSVTVTSSTPGAAVYYTVDGTTPTTASTRYTGSISVATGETIKAIAVLAGYQNSSVASAAYVIETQTATPTISPNGGSFTSVQTVTLACATPGSTILYGINATPTLTYSTPLTVSSSETVNATATAAGFTASNEASAAFTITLATPAALPTFSPAAGTYVGTQSVAISDTTPGAAIRYGINAAPNTAYTAPIPVATSETLQASATAAGYTPSAIATAAYVIQPVPQTATPTFSPVAGGYSGTQTVSISCATGGASILYGINAAPTLAYTTPLTVSTSETINAVASAVGHTLSNEASAVYTITTPSTVSIVQTKDNEGYNPPNSGSTPSTLTTQFTNKTAAGNAILDIATSADYGGYNTTLTCTDSDGNTYANVASVIGARTSLNTSQEVIAWLATNISGASATSVTDNFGGGDHDYRADYLAEIHGLNGTVQTSSTVANPAAIAPGANACVPPAITVTQVPGLLIGFCQNTSALGTGFTPSAGTGMTPLVQMWDYQGTQPNSACIATQIITTAGPVQAKFNQNSSVSEYMQTMQMYFPGGSIVGTPAATPVFSLAAGTYTGSQTLTITDSTPGSTIYYSTNNTTPTTASQIYTGPITVAASETVKAMATAPGFSQSAVGSAAYTISSGGGSAPTLVQWLLQGQTSQNLATDAGGNNRFQPQSPNYTLIGFLGVAGATAYNIYRAVIPVGSQATGTLNYGASPYASISAAAAASAYSAYVSGSGSAPYQTAVNCAYGDTAAANCVNGTQGATPGDLWAAVGYSYKVTAIVGGVESAQSAASYAVFIANGLAIMHLNSFNNEPVINSAAGGTNPATGNTLTTQWTSGASPYFNPYCGNGATEWNLNIRAFNYVQFYIKAAQNDGGSLATALENENDILINGGAQTNFSGYSTPAGNLASGVWTLVKIPLSVLATDSTRGRQNAFYKFGSMTVNGLSGTWYIDDWKFVT